MTWTAPRTWTDGELENATILNQHIRDNLLALGQPAYAFKSGDTARTSTTTLANDPDLQFAVGSGQTWAIDCLAVFTDASAASGTVDIKFAWNGPTASLAGWTIPNAYMSTSDAILVPSPFTPFDGTTAIATGAGTTARSVVMRGIITTTASGTVVLMWAPNNSSASAVTLKAGSHIIARRIA